MKKIFYFLLVFLSIIGTSQAQLIYSCGSNFSGQLGDGSTSSTMYLSPVGSDSNWSTVSCGSAFNFAIKANGSLWAWGDNSYYELGDSANIDKLVPTKIGLDSNWKTVSCGGMHTLALKNNGSLWAWGTNNSGVLGDGTLTNRMIPTRIGTDSNWKSISSCYNNSSAIKTDGTLWRWGSNFNGQIGDSTSIDRLVPTKIGSDTNWKYVSCGGNFTLALKSDGTLWAWGVNTFGELGDGTTVDKIVPVKIGLDNDWKNISCGENHSAAIKTNGSIWLWGSNLYGELGDSTTVEMHVPTQIGADTNWKSIVCGAEITFAIKNDGTLWAWGSANSGRFGDGGIVDRLSPTQVGTFSKWSNVFSGAMHTLAVRSLAEPTLIFPPNKSVNQAINPNFRWSKVYTATSYRIQVAKDSLFSTIVTNSTASDTTYPQTPNLLANSKYYWRVKAYTSTDSTVWSVVWSFTTNINAGLKTIDMKSSRANVEKDSLVSAFITNNSANELTINQIKITGGDASDFGVLNISTPFTIAANSSKAVTFSFKPMTVGVKSSTIKVIAVDTSFQTTITGVCSGDSLRGYELYGWGFGASDGAGKFPTKIGVDTNWAKISCTRNVCFGIKTNRTLWAWGKDSYGRFGNNVQYNSSIFPITIGTDTNWLSVAVGPWFHTQAIKTDGTRWGWGNPIGYGELGGGIRSNAPLQRDTNTNWSKVVCGYVTSFGLKKDGTIWVWGANTFFIRNASISADPYSATGTPTQVENDTNWKFIAGCNIHKMALKKDGTLWALGNNQLGQLGVSSVDTNTTIPVQVGSDSDWAYVACGDSSTMAIKTNGTLWGWGKNYYGQLGDSTTIDKTVPTQIGTETNWKTVACGTNQAIAIKKDGTLWACGNVNCYTSTIDSSFSSVFKQISDDTTWASVDCGGTFNLALKAPQPLYAPLLIFPPNNSENQAVNPIFRWHKPISATSYRIQVAKDSLFTTIVTNATASDTTYPQTPNLLDNTKYYWRVLAYRTASTNTDTSAWSEVWNFNTALNAGINAVDMKNSNVGVEKDSLILGVITNNMTDTLKVIQVKIAGGDSADFGVKSLSTPFNIAPKSSKDITFSFKPSSIGIKNSAIQIITADSTFQTTITGNGVNPAASAILKIIDFGKVIVNKTKDTTHIAVIKNIGSTPLSISSAKLRFGSIFTIVDSLSPITLAPDSSANISIKFSPLSANLYIDTLKIAHDGITTSTSIVLLGLGVKYSVQPITLIDFGAVPINNLIDSTVVAVIKNTSSDTLTVKSASLKNNTVFSITSEISPAIIEPGKTANIVLSFYPRIAGNYSDSLFIYYNELSSISLIKIIGNGFYSSIENVNTIIDFGKIQVNSHKDTIAATILNKGSDPVVINSTTLSGAAFSMLGGASSFTLSSGCSAIISLRFAPRAIGKYNERLRYQYGANGSSSIALIGEGMAGDVGIITDIIDFGEVKVGGFKDTNNVEALVNIGEADVSIDSAIVSSKSFEYIGQSAPFTLAPYDVAHVSLIFRPKMLGLLKDTVKYYSSALGAPKYICLQGIGIAPDSGYSNVETANAIIDFGKVTFGERKDTSSVATIINKGVSPIVVDSTILSGTAFSITGGKKNFTLAPDSSAKISLRFTPSALGAFRDSLVYYYGATETASIIIIGEGVSGSIERITQVIDFGKVKLGGFRDTSDVPTIKNSGTASVTIDTVELRIGESFDILSSQASFAFAPDSIAKASIKFKPKTLGISYDTLRYEIPNLQWVYTVVLVGEGIAPDTGTGSAKTEIINKVIDFGRKEILSINDTIVATVKNIGSVNLEIDSAFISPGDQDFRISVGNSAYTLTPGEARQITLIFEPKSLGAHSANLIYSYQGISSDTIELKGFANSKAQTVILNKVIDFGRKEILSINDTIVATVKNIGLVNLEIDSAFISPGDQDFRISVGNNAYTLTPSEERQITLIFEPKSLGAHTANLIYSYQGISSDTIELKGFASSSSIVACLIKVDSTEGEIGIKTDIPIYILNKKNIDTSGITAFEITLSFNGTVLYPLNATFGAEVAGRQFISFTAPYNSSSSDSLLYILKVLPVLGNAESTDVKIEKITPIGGSAAISGEDGEFKILGYCQAGGTRLIDGTLAKKYLAIYPNPGMEKVNIKYYSESKEQTTIYICNELGEKVMDIKVPKDDVIGLKELIIDVSNLNSGTYFIAYKTDKVFLVKKLGIVK